MLTCFLPTVIMMKNSPLPSLHTAIPRSWLRAGDGCVCRDAFVAFMRMVGI